MTSTLKKIIIGVVVVALLGLVAIGWFIIAAVQGREAAQKAGNEAATLQNMKTIAAVEIQYYNTHSRTFGTFDQLIREKMLSSKFSGDPPHPDGYLLTLKIVPRSSSQLSSYTLNADPHNSNTGNNHFYVDSTSGAIHVNAGKPADARAPLANE